MKQIRFYGSDIPECISELKSSAERLREDMDLLKNIIAGISLDDRRYELLCDARRSLEIQINNTEKCAESLLRAAELYDKAEDNIKIMIRKKLFSTERNIIVEKSRTPARSSLIGGKTLIHEDELSRLVLKDMAGDII